MEIPIKILQFFLCFTLIVGLHELGHFLTARLFRIRVEKFYIFFDPWFSLFKFRRGETEYGLGWLPLGGYVKIAGMVDESMDKEQLAGPVRQDEFRAKPAWQRFIVMIAGVVMNVLLAVAIYCGVSWAWGESYFSNDDARWGYNFNDRAHALGFEDGDRIVTIDGQRIDNAGSIPTLLLITDKVRPLQDGNLTLEIGYSSKNELGQLAQTLEQSLGRIHEYVDDIDRVMGELAQGNIDADPYWHSADKNPCRWCDYRAACHFEEGCGDLRRFRRGVSAKEFWQWMREREEDEHGH